MEKKQSSRRKGFAQTPTRYQPSRCPKGAEIEVGSSAIERYRATVMRKVQVGRVLVMVVSFGAALACASEITSRSPDEPRLEAPVPACFVRLPARPNPGGMMRQLSEREYFKLVFSQAGGEQPQAGAEGVLCNQVAAFKSEAFAGATSRLGPNVQFAEELVMYGSGPNRLRVVWFRTHEKQPGKAIGTLAVVRTTEEFAQVFALGTFEGAFETSRFSVERLGDEMLVSAVDDGCGAVKPGAECDSDMYLFKVELGQLRPILQVPVERVRHAAKPANTPAYAGVDQVTYHLEAAPSYEATQLSLLEQVTTTVQPSGKEVARAERERWLTFYGKESQWSEPSLWDRETAPAP